MRHPQLRRQPVVHLRLDGVDVHLGLLQLAGEVPVQRLPAGELVEHPDPGLAAAVAGAAVAAEGQVRLGSGGGVVDADHARPDALAEAERRLRVGGVDGGRQPVARQVAQLDRLVEGVEGAHAHDRAEGLLAEDVVVGPQAVQQHRVVVQPGRRVAVEALARRGLGDPADRLRAEHGVVVGDRAEHGLETVGELLVQQRAVEHVAGRLADRGRAQRLVQARDELVVQVAVHDQVAQRGAALAGRAPAGEQRALHRQVQVGVGGHDHRVLAAQLQARALQVASAELADAGADRAGTGEADLVDRARLQGGLQALEGRLAIGVDEVEHAARHAGAPRQLGDRAGGGRGVLGGLPHHGVAAQQRRDDVPGGHRDREVARGDHRGDPDRDPEGEQLLVGHLRRHGLPVEPAPLAEEEVAGVDDLLDLAQRLGVGLADLAGHQLGQRLLVRLDQPSQARDHAAAHRGGHLGPLALGALGVLGGDAQGVRAAEPDPRHHVVEVRRVAREVLGAAVVHGRGVRADH